VNDFNQSINDSLIWVGDLFYQGCKDFLQEVEEISWEVEATADELLAPLYGWLDSVEDLIGDRSRPFVQTVSPVLQHHPACVGCTHYHGEFYGENFLVCGMHPYGVEASSCEDWQSVWENESN
jgi:hypothetical protein